MSVLKGFIWFQLTYCIPEQKPILFKGKKKSSNQKYKIHSAKNPNNFPGIKKKKKKAGKYEPQPG